MKLPSWCDCYAPLIGRVLMGGMFLMSGANKALDLSSTASYISGAGLPYPVELSIIALTAEVLFGLALILGYKTKIAATGLIVFTALVTLLFHSGQNEELLFSKNMAIMAGLLYMMTYGSGLVAADNKRRTR